MTRTERSEYNYIKRSIKNNQPGNSAQLTIRTDAGREYKQELDKLYTGLDFHPAAITTDPHRFDEHERIIYIKGTENFTELYTEDEKTIFASKLN